jgi:ribose-phosphate pyrophosphokinase
MAQTFKLYSTSTAKELAASVAKELDVEVKHIFTEKFSDGELFVRFDESVRGEVVFILAKIHMPYENLFELLIAMDAAKRSSARELIVVVPYLPHSRQERRDGQRTAITSRMVADLIQQGGADRLVTLDLHTNAIEGYFKIPVDPLSSQSLFIDHIQKQNLPDLCLCSPDFGGIKRAKQYKKELNCSMVVINKERLKANSVDNMEIIGEVNGKNVVIIDDLVDTAGTLCKAADLIIASGAKSVQAYCTHGILSGNALQNIEASSLKRLVITNTVQDQNVGGKVEVVSCAPVLAKAIRNILATFPIQ